jgi:hypothetical protein
MKMFIARPERESTLETWACVFVESNEIDVKTIQTDVKEAEYQNVNSVRLEWRWAVLYKQNIFYPWSSIYYFPLYSNTVGRVTQSV